MCQIPITDNGFNTGHAVQDYYVLLARVHCKKINVNLTCSLLFWMQVSEQITHMDSDNYHSDMRMRRKNQIERGKVSYEIPLCK